ncbi:MAG: chemotaxis protein CheA, partial [Phycisphaerae bacterium]|nr:chemotaxis protein CheA [Phycisphaerae bacterium]NIX32415.1 chemotaxis protein CheA [Phycisphaerae bacterium]
VFRALHTIKGSSAMAGVDPISNFVHEIETAFELVRDEELQVSRDLINQTLAAKDVLKVLAHSLDGDSIVEPPEVAEIVSWFRGILPSPSDSEEPPEGGLVAEGATTYR